MFDDFDDRIDFDDEIFDKNWMQNRNLPVKKKRDVVTTYGSGSSPWLPERIRRENEQRSPGLGDIAASVLVALMSPTSDDPAWAKVIEPEYGDVLIVRRRGGLYCHFGVYVGNGRVIHYAAADGDFAGTPTIHETTLNHFRGSSESISVLEFPADGSAPRIKAAPGSGAVIEPDEEHPFFELCRSQDYHLYSPAETVRRARSRLGETSYSLPGNNCEHFALWCKTGVSESHQVNVWATRIGKMLASAFLNRRR